MTDSPVVPRLVAVTGVLSGETFPLDAPAVTFGRDALNTICCPDPALSRRHCVFTNEIDGWMLRDLDSSNGTFVNGVQVTTQRLSEGDRIGAGGSVFLFVHTLGTASRQPDPAEIDVLAPTTRLSVDETIYLKEPGGRAAVSRMEEGLRALLAISTALNQVRTERDLHLELLRVLRNLVGSDAAAVVLVRPGGDLEVVDSLGAGEGPVAVSRRLISRVLAERSGLLTRDASVSRSFASDKLVLQGARSILCVPIVARQTPLGALYLVSTDRAAFDDDHLQLVTAAGHLAAIALENVRYVASVEWEAERMRADLQLDHRMVGSSAPMKSVYERLSRVARTDTTILVTGETGTGKELAARAVHLNGDRARRPFVAVNCAALAENLIESELFGHERGAFTGAHAQKKGRLELADGGTVFLDEIGELPLAVQSKLLRALQEREIERLGGTRPITIDVRIVSATNRDLAAEVRAGRFRQDLYFRLNVVSVEMPPLRDRPGDIPMLARHFLERLAPKAGRRLRGLSEEALACLCAYEWPGNVRELENAIERAVVLGSADQILREDLPETVLDSMAAVRDAGDPDEGFHAAVLDAKRRAIVRAFRASGGRYTETARALGIHPNYLHRLVRNLGLRAALAGER